MTIAGVVQRDEKYRRFYVVDTDAPAPSSAAYCRDVVGLFKELNYVHRSTEWRLFIDSSNSSLKAVLVHNSNKMPSLPLYYGVDCIENRIVIQRVINKIDYASFKWKICSDLKMIAILLGMKGGWPRNPCFLCNFNSRAKEHHYSDHRWAPRGDSVIRELSIEAEALVDRNNVMIPPLHVKLGVVKNFLKFVVAKQPAGRQYLKAKFPKLSDSKITEGKVLNLINKLSVIDWHELLLIFWETDER